MNLEKLHTRQLMQRLRGIRAGTHPSHFKPAYRDYTPEEQAALEAEVNAIKAILATREHIPNKVEAKATRQANQRSKQVR